MGGCQSQNMPVEETTIVAAVNTLDAEVEAGMPKVEGVVLDQVSGYQAAPIEKVASGAPIAMDNVQHSGMIADGILTANAMEVVDVDPALLHAASIETAFKGYNSPEEAMAAYEAQMAANAAQLPPEVQAFNKEQYENAGRHPFHYQENQPQAMYVNQPHASGYVVDQPIMDHQIAQSVHEQSVAGDIQHAEHPQQNNVYAYQLAGQVEYEQQHSEAFQNQAYAHPSANQAYASTQPQPINEQAQPLEHQAQPLPQPMHQGVQPLPQGYEQQAIGYGQYRQPINEQPKPDEQPQPIGYEQPAYEQPQPAYEQPQPVYEQPAPLEEPSQLPAEQQPAVIEEDGKIIQQFEKAEEAVDDAVDEVESDQENDDTLVAEKDQKKKSSKGKKKKKTSSKKKRWGWM